MLLLVAAMWYFSSLALYFAFSLIITLILTPVAQFLERVPIWKGRRMPAWTASMICLLLGFSVLTTIFIMFVPLAVQQAKILSNLDFNTLISSLNQPLSDLERALKEAGIIEQDLKAVISSYLKEKVNTLLNADNLSSIFGGLLGFTGDFFITIFSITFISFFLLKDGQNIRRELVDLLPIQHQKKVNDVLNRIGMLLSRYLVGLVMQVTAITILVSSAFYLLGLDNGLIIGLFAGIANLVPYLGPLLGATFALIITLSTYLGTAGLSLAIVPQVIKVIATFAGMQLMDNAVFQPVIFSNSVRAHPLEIFTVIIMGGKAGGILAMVLAIPTYTIIRVIVQESYRSMREKRQNGHHQPVEQHTATSLPQEETPSEASSS